MKKAILSLLLVILTATSRAQDVPVIDFDKFEPVLHQNNDTVYVINFWATWCMPCIEEMPDLLNFSSDMKDHKFRLILVSLDNPDHLETRVKPFLKKHGIRETVILLDDPDANRWIEKVHTDWMGSIPGTLIYSRDFRQFYSDKIDYSTLKKIVEPKLKKQSYQ